jgi:hypothetical protein
MLHAPSHQLLQLRLHWTSHGSHEKHSELVGLMLKAASKQFMGLSSIAKTVHAVKPRETGSFAKTVYAIGIAKCIRGANSLWNGLGSSMVALIQIHDDFTTCARHDEVSLVKQSMQ